MSKGTNVAFILCVTAAILILANGLWIASNKEPIIFSSPLPDYTSLTEDSSIFWGRVVLGIPGLVEGALLPLWLFLGVVVLFAAIMMYINPKRHTRWGLTIILFSILSIPIGGGFILGLILAIIGGGAAIEWPKPVSSTFLGKMFRAIKFDSRFYHALKEEPKALEHAAMVLFLVAFLSGLGHVIYAYNAFMILDESNPLNMRKVLLLGGTSWDISVLASAIGYIGYSVARWLLLTSTIYLVGVKLTGRTTEFHQLATTTAYAYVPISLQILLPVLFTAGIWLTTYWPLMVLSVTYLWMTLALILAVKQSLGIHTTRAFGTIVLGVALFWIIDSMLTPLLEVPGVQIVFLPKELMLYIITFLTLLAGLLGVFSKR